MPWCPKCKNEYRAGITVCADCNVDLVEELAGDPKENCEVLVALEQEENAKKLVAYLEYSSIEAFYESAPEQNCFPVYVLKKSVKQAKKAFSAFYAVEAAASLQAEMEKQAAFGADTTDLSDAAESASEEDNSAMDAPSRQSDFMDSKDSTSYEDSDSEEDNEEEAASTPLSNGAATYVTKAEKSADYRSTGFTFTIFGSIGLIVMLLHWLKIFQYFTTMSAVIMTIMFIAFIFIGIDSFRRAKTAAAESTEEEQFTAQLTQWLDENLTQDMLAAVRDASVSDEINFLNEMAEMKRIITAQFGELDTTFLEQFAEDYYNEHFA